MFSMTVRFLHYGYIIIYLTSPHVVIGHLGLFPVCICKSFNFWVLSKECVLELAFLSPKG